MKIAFVGGGTGGHFYPLIAVAEELVKEQDKPRLYYLGPDPYEPDTLKDLNIKFVWIPSGKVRLYFSVRNLFDPFISFLGIFVSLWKLYWMYPDVIFSKGSFTSFPVLVAAWFLRIPVVIHESDAVPGRANSFAKGFAKYIAISYPEASQYFNEKKTALTGIPIRFALQIKDPDPFTNLGIPNDLPLIYVTGGSSGAVRLNNLILRSLDELLPHYRIFHQTGSHNHDEIVLTAKSLISDPLLQERYYTRGHISANTVSSLLEAASLVITRAGSTAIHEIALHGKPSIIIPIPEDISRDQRSNAYAYARTGAATVMEERNLTEALLFSEATRILEDKERWQKMSDAAANFTDNQAAAKIATLLLEIGKSHE